MKKLFMLVLAAALLLTMSVSALAMPAIGDIYEYDSSSLESYGGSFVPGKTYYICVEPNGDSAHKPKDSKAKLSYTCTRRSDDKKFSIATSTSLSISKRKYGNNYAYFAELKLKDIPTSSYHEDGFDFSGTISFKDYSGGNASFTIADPCNYPNGGSTVYNHQSYYYFNDEGDVELDVEGTDVKIAFNTNGVEYRLLLAMDTTYDEKLSDKYPSANLDFYNGNGASFKSSRKATITIPREGTQYLYEYSGSTLTQITSRNSDGDFEFKTDKLGKYVVSDTKLAAAGVPTPTPAPTTTPGLTPPYGGGFFNPGTGACA